MSLGVITNNRIINGPFEHIQALGKALNKGNKPYAQFVLDKKDMVFSNVDNQITYIKKIITFFDSYFSQFIKKQNG